MKKYILTLLCAMFALTAMGQKTVTGQVLDSDGLPMAYAAVKVEGTNTLVRTDDNGQLLRRRSQRQGYAQRFLYWL